MVGLVPSLDRFLKLAGSHEAIRQQGRVLRAPPGAQKPAVVGDRLGVFALAVLFHGHLERGGGFVGEGFLGAQVQPVRRGGIGPVEGVGDHERRDRAAVHVGQIKQNSVGDGDVAGATEPRRLFKGGGMLGGPRLGLGGQVRGDAGACAGGEANKEETGEDKPHDVVARANRLRRNEQAVSGNTIAVRIRHDRSLSYA